MKHSIFVKFIAVALCALSLVVVVAGGLAIIMATEQGLYAQTPQQVLQGQQEDISQTLAQWCAEQYALDHLGDLPQELRERMRTYSYYAEDFDYILELCEAGACLQTYSNGDASETNLYEYNITPNFAVVADVSTFLDDSYRTETAAEGTAPTTPPGMETAEADMLYKMGEPLWSEVLEISSWDEEGRLWHTEYLLYYYSAPTYQLRVHLDKNASYNDAAPLLEPLYQFRYHYIGAVALGMLFFAVTLVYLCCAAGRRSGTTEVRPMGLNRVPLDLYAAVAAAGCALLIWIGWEVFYWVFNNEENWALLSVTLLCAYVVALLAIGWVFAFAAQVKSKGGYWWRHMILGWVVSQLGRFFRWLGRGLVWGRNGIRAVFNLLPVIWQWLVTAAVMVGSVALTFLLAISSYGFGEVFWGLLCVICILGSVVMVLYGGYCFGTLLKGARNMAHGNLDHKVPDRYLYGAFGDFAGELNNLAQGAKIAAERQMKSERMKTELITNVSHDIKTPLTSIINYVDLMKKPHSAAENEQYLEVLDRQSQRLKKLVDDLMEMSKASSGNLTVELGRVDAVEAVNQALGEFADKLSYVNLTPVFRHPDTPVIMHADGRLVWRVLSNLLSNAVKYAMPDTRLYIDLMVLQGNAVIAIKNISREQLNVNADELMERFVRGDTSRNTEGSGLGLNIAKSLVELQQGQMHLMVDGDLFKVTLIFPLI